MDKFDRIYEEYFRDVYLFILTLSKNQSVAEEITQETFFKALKNIGKFRGDCSMKVWLCQIAKNTYYSYLKKQTSFLPEELEDDRVQPDDMVDEFIKRESVVSLYKIIRNLDEPYKEVFIMRVLGELSFQEIGAIFERKEGWARVTYHRAKLKIQDLIEEEG